MEPCRLARGLWPRPFEEAVGRHHASTLLERVAECASSVDRLRARIDCLARHARVFRSALHEAPGSGNHFAVFVLYPDDEMILRRCDVVARPIIYERVCRHAEFSGQRIAVAPCNCESSAHRAKLRLCRLAWRRECALE